MLVFLSLSKSHLDFFGNKCFEVDFLLLSLEIPPGFCLCRSGFSAPAEHGGHPARLPCLRHLRTHGPCHFLLHSLASICHHLPAPFGGYWSWTPWSAAFLTSAQEAQGKNLFPHQVKGTSEDPADARPGCCWFRKELEERGPFPCLESGMEMTIEFRNWPPQVQGLTKWSENWLDVPSLCRDHLVLPGWGYIVKKTFIAQWNWFLGSTLCTWGTNINKAGSQSPRNSHFNGRRWKMSQQILTKCLLCACSLLGAGNK